MADIVVDGNVYVTFVPTIANPSAPTVAELTAGTVLHDALVPTGLEGFEASNEEVDNTSLGSTFNTRLPGRLSFSGTRLVLKKQSGSDTVFTALSTSNTDGYVCIRLGESKDTAPTASQKFEVFPGRTGQWSWVGLGEANSVARYAVPFTISDEPEYQATVAA